MGVGEALFRSIMRPLALTRRRLPPLSLLSPLPPPGAISPPPLPAAAAALFRPVLVHFPRCFCTSVVTLPFDNSLSDTRFPKRRPGMRSRRKRASLKPPGPYAWVQYVPGEPIPRSRPNEGSVKRRNEKKRIKQRKTFILSEKKKRKAQWAEARRKKEMERIERKMAAVAREKAWPQRLIELQQLEEAKKAAMAS